MGDVGEIRSGQKVLIVGASGGVGTFAVPGRFIGPVDRIIKAVLLSLFIGQTMRPLDTKPSSEDLEFLRQLIEAGSITPVIDRTYPLSEAADAIRYLETGRARGKVVISVSAAPTTSKAAPWKPRAQSAPENR
jgi:NADPH:quinone reductase-like Zn-dependent oxidoreductase